MEIDYSLIEENLSKNNIDCSFIKSKEQLIEEFDKLVADGSSIYMGGSTSLVESGLVSYLNESNKYDFHDRTRTGITSDEKTLMSKEAFMGDVFICSANAITLKGEIYQVDGTGNRVAAMMFGPKKVILVVGKNKIVNTLKDAVERVKNVATPQNTRRLNIDTYCNTHDHCFKAKFDCENLMAVPAGTCKNTICSMSTVFTRQQVKGRIHVIFVDENLGY